MTGRKKINSELLFIFAAMGIWLIYAVFITILRYKSFDFKLMDQGTFYYIIEHLRNNGSWFDFSTDFAHRLGIHFSVILALFVPFHYISASPVTMQIIQLIVASFGALGIYLITSKVFTDSSSNIIRRFLPVLYLGFHPFLRSQMFDFDVVRLAPTFIIFFLYFTLFNQKIYLSILFILLLCITRETLLLLVAGTGLYLFITGNKKAGTAYLFAGFGVFLLTTLFIMPWMKTHYAYDTRFTNESLVYLSSRFNYIQGNTSAEKAAFALSHPLLLLKIFFTAPAFKWATLAGMYLMLFFLPLLDIKRNIIIIFTVGIYYLSNSDVTFIYKHQYFGEIYPVIFICGITGFRKAIDYIGTRRAVILKTAALIQIIIIAVNLIWLTSYYVGKYRDSVKIQDQLECVTKDVLGINAMKNDEAAIFCHNRLFLYYDWKRYMTYYMYFGTAYNTYSKIPSIKRMYLITIKEPALGDKVSEEFDSILPLAKEKGFTKKFEYKNFIAYEKIVK